MIKHIVTHKRPHADELVARMLLRRFDVGEKMFPGVSSASTGYMTTGELPDGKTWQDFPDTVFLGCAGSPFDEHATSSKGRDEGESCVTLVAKYLGLQNERGLEKILFYVKQEDLKGSKVKLEIPSIIKLIHSKYDGQDEDIALWTEMAYFAVYEEENARWQGLNGDERLWIEERKEWQPITLDSVRALLIKQSNPKALWWYQFALDAIKYQEQRFREAELEFANKAKLERVRRLDGRNLNFVVIESDNEEMNKCARSKGADVVLQFQDKGRCLIATNQKASVDLSYAFILLRMAEQHYRGGVTITDEGELSKEGFVLGVPCWYLFHTKKMGFNGSLTATDVEPSKIPREKIIDCVREGIKRS